MSDACVIEVRARTAGIVVREGGSFCFFAAHRDFDALERQSFDSLLAAQAAATRCIGDPSSDIQADLPRPGSRRA